MFNIWEIGFPDEYELEDLEINAVQKAEEKLSVKFPKSYLNILKEKNGGRLKLPMTFPNVFPATEGFPEGETLDLEYLLGISERECEGVLTTFQMREEWELPKDIVLLSGDGHTWVVLDYRNYTGDNPPVSYLDSEYEIDKIIASDFESFLNQLQFIVIEDLEEDKYILPSIDYKPEEIESVIKKGVNTSNMTIVMDGLKYMAEKEYDINWFLDQMICLADNQDYYTVFTCEYYFIERLKTAKKQEIDISKMNLLIDKLKKYPVVEYFDVNGVVPRGARKIEKLVSLMQ